MMEVGSVNMFTIFPKKFFFVATPKCELQKLNTWMKHVLYREVVLPF